MLLDVKPTGHYPFQTVALDERHRKETVADKLLKERPEIVRMKHILFLFQKMLDI